MGQVGKNICSKSFNMLMDLGLDIIKDKAVSFKEKKKIEKMLADFLSRKVKENTICSLDEEIDFEGLCAYIQTDLHEDMKIRLFGDKEERNNARKRILEKSLFYSKAHTQLSEKRTKDIVTKAMTLIKKFYQNKVPIKLRCTINELEENICEYQDKKSQEIMDHLDSSSDKIVQAINGNSLLSVDTNISSIADGKFGDVEKKISLALNANGALHPLFPNYRISFHTIDGKSEAFSEPISPEALNKNPPNMKLHVNATLDGNASTFTNDDLNYSYRHQIPFKLNVIKAEKFLGNIPDPYQHEAEREVGKEYDIYPPKFPRAFPCSLKAKGQIIEEYILLGLVDITDDGVYIISNDKQETAPYRFVIKYDTKTNNCQYKFACKNNMISSELKTLKIIKCLLETKEIEVYALEKHETISKLELDDASCQPLYKPLFDNIDEDIYFLEQISKIEEYFKIKVELPDEFNNKDIQNLKYLSDIITGNICGTYCKECNMGLLIDSNIREQIQSYKGAHLRVVLNAVFVVEVWHFKFELPINRSYINVMFKDIEHLKETIKKINDNDLLNVTLISEKPKFVVEDIFDKSHEQLCKCQKI